MALLAAAAGFVPAVAHAQPATATPVASPAAIDSAQRAFRDAVRALEARRWRDAAALVHPVTLRDARAWDLRSLRHTNVAVAGDCRRPSSSVPPAAPAPTPCDTASAAAREREAREASRVATLAQYAGVRTADELAALPLVDAYARRLEAAEPCAAVERMMADQRTRAPDAPTPVGVRADVPARSTLGAVAQDDSTVHVTYLVRRMTVDLARCRDSAATVGARESSVVPAIATMRRTPDGWRVLGGQDDRALPYVADAQGMSYSWSWSVEDEDAPDGRGAVSDAERARWRAMLATQVRWRDSTSGAWWRARLTEAPAGAAHEIPALSFDALPAALVLSRESPAGRGATPARLVVPARTLAELLPLFMPYLIPAEMAKERDRPPTPVADPPTTRIPYAAPGRPR